ncbi:hypothetical protein PQX77_013606 [Marasmius sp. AFHP31]|nr:hypothetical protein PQX77_013606 [Marasmius sp. AFHP31]
MPKIELNEEVIAAAAADVNVGQVVLYPASTILAMYLVYGLYIPIFGCALYILRRQDFENRKLYMTCTIALFVISTCVVINDTVFTIDVAKRQFGALKNQDWEPYIHFRVQHKGKAAVTSIFYILPALANIAAETMLIHRCYTIWGSSKRVGIPLIVISALGSLISIIGAILVSYGISQDTTIEHNVFLLAVGEFLILIGFILSVLVNVSVTVLTGNVSGRIWWVNRESKIYLGVNTDNKLTHAMRIIIESGFMYPTMMIIQAIIANTSGGLDDPLPVDLVPVLVLSAAIAPALVVVRAHFDRTIKTEPAKQGPALTNLQFASPDTRKTTGTVSRVNTSSTSHHLRSVGEPERQRARKSEATVPLLSVAEDIPESEEMEEEVLEQKLGEEMKV